MSDLSEFEGYSDRDSDETMFQISPMKENIVPESQVETPSRSRKRGLPKFLKDHVIDNFKTDPNRKYSYI